MTPKSWNTILFGSVPFSQGRQTCFGVVMWTVHGIILKISWEEAERCWLDMNFYVPVIVVKSPG